MSQRSMGSYSQKSQMSQQQQQAAGQRPDKTTYTIAVKTSNVRNAGTDANVYVQLTGEKGIGPQVKLKTSLNHRNKFERNHSDVFVFHDQQPLGALKQLKIWHDNAGVGPGWHLQVVEVNDGASGISYVFPCNQWLDKKEGDRQLCRVLNCARTKQKLPKQLRIAAEISQQQGQQQDGDQYQGQQQQQQWPQQAQGQQPQWPQQGQQWPQPAPGQGWPMQPGQQQQWSQQQQWPQQQGGQGSYVSPRPSYPYKSQSPPAKVAAPEQSQETQTDGGEKEKDDSSSEM